MLILKNTPITDNKPFCNLFLFTIGKKVKVNNQNNREEDFKFGMYAIKKTNQELSVDRKNYTKVYKYEDIFLDDENDPIFTFYEQKNNQFCAAQLSTRA